MMESAMSGLRAADTMFSAAAHNVANVNTPDYKPLRVDLAAVAPISGVAVTAVGVAHSAPAPPPELSGADVGSEMVASSQIALMYAANLSVLRTHDQTVGQLLSIRG